MSGEQTTTERRPAEVFHPSVFIVEEMEERGWNRDILAAAMLAEPGTHEWTIARVSLDFYLDVGPLEPDLRMGADGAQQFARAFGTSADFWLNLETAWLNGARHAK